MGAGCCIDRWRLVPDQAVPSALVVVLLPVADEDPGLGQRSEDVDVEALVALAALVSGAGCAFWR